MARILAYTSPARGHLFPIIPVLDELRARGHAIVLRTLASYLEMARERGFIAAAIDSAIEREEHDDYKARTGAGRRQRLGSAGCRGEVGRAVGLVVPVSATAPVARRAAVRPGFRPARGRLGRLRDSLVAPVTCGALERVVLPLVNEVRAGVGVTPLTDASSMFMRPPVLLSMTAEPFEYPRSDWPENIHFVGPCDWDVPMQIPDWLQEIDQPIVLVTTSSEFQDDARLVQAALDGLAGGPLAVIATLSAGDPSGLQRAGAHVERFIPHRTVLRHAVCAVTHGGMGATQKALAAGVPVCAVPFGRDQLEIARRVEVARGRDPDLRGVPRGRWPRGRGRHLRAAAPHAPGRRASR